MDTFFNMRQLRVCEWIQSGCRSVRLGSWLCRFPRCLVFNTDSSYCLSGEESARKTTALPVAPQVISGRHFRVSVSRCVAPDHYVSSFPAGILFVPHVSRLSGNDEQSRHTFHGNQEFNFSGCFLARFCTFHNRRIFPH